MKIKVGQRLKINGEIYTIARLLMPSTKVITTTGEEFYANWDDIEEA